MVVVLNSKKRIGINVVRNMMDGLGKFEKNEKEINKEWKKLIERY